MTTEETPFDVQIRLLEKNLNELKKLTQIANLENELLCQQQELRAAQARLDATKSSGLALPSQSPAAADTPIPDASTSQAVTEFIDAVRSTIPQPLPGGNSDRDQPGLSALVEEVSCPEVVVDGQIDGEDETVTVRSDQQSAAMDLSGAGSDGGDLQNGDLDDRSPDHRDLDHGGPNGEHHNDEDNNGPHVDVDVDVDVDSRREAQVDDTDGHNMNEESSEEESSSASTSASGEESNPGDSIGKSTPPMRPVQPLSFRVTPGRIVTSPPEPNAPFYRGESWPECKKFIAAMESHFARYKGHYTETRKVELGARFLGDEVKENWHHYVVDLQQGTTWDSYCVFLVQQLLRECGPTKATNILMNGKQKARESVSEFALWLKMWEPATFDYLPQYRPNFLVTLANGILGPIKSKTKRSYKEFGEDYFGFARYLQSMEDSIRERRELLGRPDPDAEDAPLSSGATDHESQFEAFSSSPVQPAQMGHRSPSPSFRGAPPADQSSPVRRDQPTRRFSPAPPTPPIGNPYEGKSWWECKNLVGNLQALFARHPAWYSDDRKVEVGTRYLSKEMHRRWIKHSQTLGRSSCTAFFIFLARQVPCQGTSDEIRNTYFDRRQKENESVLDYALFLERHRQSSSLSKSHDPCRHLHARVLPILQRNADLDCGIVAWKNFRAQEFSNFVELLQETEKKIPARQHALKDRNVVPRKRTRED